MNATPQGTTPPAAPATPARRFIVNAHGNEDLQRRLDVAAPALEALFFGTSAAPAPEPVAPTVPPALTEPPPISAAALGEMATEDLRAIQKYGETLAVRYAATLVLIGRASYDPTAVTA